MPTIFRIMNARIMHKNTGKMVDASMSTSISNHGTDGTGSFLDKLHAPKKS